MANSFEGLDRQLVFGTVGWPSLAKWRAREEVGEQVSGGYGVPHLPNVVGDESKGKVATEWINDHVLELGFQDLGKLGCDSSLELGG